MLTVHQYHALAASVSGPAAAASPFFAAAPVPQLAKMGPGLLVRSGDARATADAKAHAAGSAAEAGSSRGAARRAVETKAAEGLGVTTRAFLDTMGATSGVRVVLHAGVDPLRAVRQYAPLSPLPCAPHGGFLFESAVRADGERASERKRARARGSMERLCFSMPLPPPNDEFSRPFMTDLLLRLACCPAFAPPPAPPGFYACPVG